MGEFALGMSRAVLRRLSLGLSVVCMMALAACSNSKKEDQPYLHAKAPPPLEVPPGLAMPKQDADTALPELPPTAPTAEVGITPPNLLKQAQAPAPEETTPPAAVTLHIEQQGAQRWLVVPAPADQVWRRVKGFLVEQGFTLAQADEKTGTLETDWRDEPQAAQKNEGNAASKRGLKDKFTLHVAAGRVSGSSEVTVAHLGLQRIVAKGKAQWQPRAADPTLAAALLDKLQAYFQEKQDTSAADADMPAVRATVTTDSTTGVSTLSLKEDFDRAWQRIGATLRRSGFVIEDRNRSEGVYLVRLGEAFKDAKPGLVSQLLGGDDNESDKRYRIHVKDQGDKSTVRVEHPGGAPVHTGIGVRILNRLKDKMG